MLYCSGWEQSRARGSGSWAESTGKSPAVLLGVHSDDSWEICQVYAQLSQAFSVQTAGKKQSSVSETKANPPNLQGDPERENSETLYPSSLQQR